MTESVAKTLPRGLARRRAMLEAARALFLEKGFENTSLSDIVDRSKGSRSTLYEQFGNKEGLLRAMVEDQTARLWEAIDWTEAVPEATDDAIVDLAVRFVKLALAQESVAVYRIVIAEGHRMPEIARLFFESGPELFQQRLADIFRKAQAAGRLKEGRPEIMARAFGGTALGDLHLRRVLGLISEVRDDEIEDFVRSTMRAFLYGVATRPE
jgi:AcrR family transcriptional regulator